MVRLYASKFGKRPVQRKGLKGTVQVIPKDGVISFKSQLFQLQPANDSSQLINFFSCLTTSVLALLSVPALSIKHKGKKFKSASTLPCYVNPLTPKISLVILLTVCQTVLVMLVWKIWYWINF